jgi:hypothetical protein
VFGRTLDVSTVTGVYEMKNTRFRSGDLVEIKSAAEIFESLDDKGALDALPFMSEMLQYCGRRFVVDRRADKLCDTIHYTGSRRIGDAVFLEDLRCDGSAHDGCQAECRIIWKESWLRPVGTEESDSPTRDGAASSALLEVTSRHAKYSNQNDGGGETTYHCQATELYDASEHLKLWDPRPYAREYVAGNVSLGRFLRVMARVIVVEPLRKLGLMPKVPLPGSRTAVVAEPTLGLQPGEWVQVKSKDEIAETLSPSGRNRGLWFDKEMMPICGTTHRVRQRVHRFINDQDRRMIELKSDAVTLDGAVCSGELSHRRWFCSRAIYPYWRESWLRRVDADADAPPGDPAGTSAL